MTRAGAFIRRSRLRYARDDGVAGGLAIQLPRVNLADRLPRGARVLYASASIAGNAVSQTWTLWLVYFYAPPADADITPRVADIGGVDDRVVLGAVLTVARLIEALDDPLIGYWSDRTSSRWGRRIPFILFGTPVWVVLFVLLFLPPVEGAAVGNLVYLFFAAQIFYLFSNLSGAPIEALLPSVAPRTDDRLSIASWQVLFGVVGALIGLTLSAVLRAAFGFTAMALIIGGIALAARYLSLGAIWQRAREDREPATRGLRRALRETFSNPHLLAYLPSFVLFQVGLQMLTALIPFYVDAVLYDSTFLNWNGSDDEGVFTALFTATVIAGVLCGVPLFARLARGGKATAYRTAMVGVTVIFPLLFFAGFVPGVSELPQTLVMLFVAGIPVAGVFLFPNVITADIVDEDAERTSTRREAMIYGSQNQVEKLATALSPLLFALVLLAGDSTDDSTGLRLVGPVAGLLVFTGWLAFRRYRLEEGAVRPAAVG